MAIEHLRRTLEEAHLDAAQERRAAAELLYSAGRLRSLADELLEHAARLEAGAGQPASRVDIADQPQAETCTSVAGGWIAALFNATAARLVPGGKANPRAS